MFWLVSFAMKVHKNVNIFSIDEIGSIPRFTCQQITLLKVIVIFSFPYFYIVINGTV